MMAPRIFWLKQNVQLVIAFVAFVAVTTTASAASLSAGLSTDEQNLAMSMAERQVWPQARSSLLNSAHALGIQTLSVELDERKKNNQQHRSRVYQFNYNSQQSRIVLIDLITGEVVKVQAIDSVHLPLNEQEIETARSLIEQQPDIMAALSEERQSRGLTTLTDLSNIDVKASVFEPNDDAHVCAKQRCALISLFDGSRTVFSVEPLVNLQRLNVTTLRQSL